MRTNETTSGYDITKDPIFQPLKFKSGLEVKNRLFRSNISGRFDNYDGSGNYVRVNWEESFAKGGVGCIISSFVPVNEQGRVMVNYAMIDKDERIPFWRTIGERVHKHDCHFIMQLSHSGRQRDNGGVENRYRKALSSTSQTDYFHGILCRAMSKTEIRQIVDDFAEGARRAKEAGLDGVELHGANGYLITQFLSSGINDRTDEYGGSLRNRARFVLEIIDAIRQKVGDFHLQLKISAEDWNNALYPWYKRGNRLEDSIQVCRWAVEQGIDALHVSSGSLFPHPRNPPGDFPVREVVVNYDSMLASGVRTRFNYSVFKHWLIGPLFRWWWNHRRGIPYAKIVQGISVPDAAAIKKEMPDNIPVIVTGGMQDASVIRGVLAEGKADAVSMARTLVANRDLPHIFASGKDLPDEPCTYCNKCLMNDIKNPLGCYELSRFDGDYEAMIREVYSVFYPGPKSYEPDGETPSGAPPTEEVPQPQLSKYPQSQLSK